MACAILSSNGQMLPGSAKINFANAHSIILMTTERQMNTFRLSSPFDQFPVRRFPGLSSTGCLRGQPCSPDCVIDEISNPAQQLRGLITMRRVSAIGQFHNPGLRDASHNTIDLQKSTILVVNTLHRQQWAFDRGDFRLDAPVAKGRQQPDIVPAPEGRIRIVVVRFQPLFQIGCRGRSCAPARCC